MAQTVSKFKMWSTVPGSDNVDIDDTHIPVVFVGWLQT